MKKVICSILLILMTVIIPAGEVKAQEEVIDKIETKEELENFVDKFMSDNMDKFKVEGAAISIIMDGEITLEKGYGYESIETKIPVDPKKTLFHNGSITKTFTATAVMQLVEEGKIDLDKDINEYLDDFQVKSPYKEKITMKNLLTHTAGFDEAYFGFYKVKDYDLSLEDFVKECMPRIKRRPGEIIEYSNYGIVLAGYIVEKVSGVPYEKYIEENIFKDLEMKSSLIYTGVDKPENMIEPYEFNEKLKKYELVNYRNTNFTAAGSMYTTASDMTNYILENINYGEYNNKRILSEKYSKEMLSTQFSHEKGFHGYGYGFYEINVDGNNVLAHGGNLPPYSSMMGILPEDKFGVFITTNTNSGNELNNEFLVELIKRVDLNNRKITYNVPKDEITLDVDEFVGEYSFLRTPEKSFFKIFFGPQNEMMNIHINKISENELLLKSSGMDDINLKRVSNMIFKNKDREEYFVFNNGSSGELYLSIASEPMATFEKHSFYENSLVVLGVMAITLVIFIVYVIASIIKKIRKKGTVKLIPNVMSMCNLFAVIGMLAYILMSLNNGIIKTTPLLIGTLIMPIISMILLITYIIKNIKNKERQNYIIIIASIIFYVTLYFFNLIGFQF